MWPTLLDLRVVRVTVFGLALAAAFVLGSFIFWRRLRRDYDSEKLLSMWLWLVAASWVGSGVWIWWSNSGRQIWGAIVLPLFVLAWWASRQKWDFWEILDIWGPVTLVVAVLGAGGWGPHGWRVALVSAIGIVIVSLVHRFYRGWQWYQSGRAGVAGIVSVAWWGVINLVIANFNWWAVYSLGWMAVLALVVIYLRSGRRLWQK